MSNHLYKVQLLGHCYLAPVLLYVADLGIVAICSEQRDAGVDDDGDELDHLQRGEVPLTPQILLPLRQKTYFG